MKLFKPVVHVNVEGGVRSITFKLADSDEFFVKAESINGDMETAKIDHSPQTPEDQPEAPEIEFLTGVYASASKLVYAFLSAKDETELAISKGALGVLFDSMFRAIEHTPRAAEGALEMRLMIEATGMPPMLATILFQDQVEKGLVTPPSELELRLREKGQPEGSTPVEVLRQMMQTDMPAATYQYVHPAITSEEVAMFEKRRAEIFARREMSAAAKLH